MPPEGRTVVAWQLKSARNHEKSMSTANAQRLDGACLELEPAHDLVNADLSNSSMVVPLALA